MKKAVSKDTIGLCLRARETLKYLSMLMHRLFIRAFTPAYLGESEYRNIPGL